MPDTWNTVTTFGTARAIQPILDALGVGAVRDTLAAAQTVATANAAITTAIMTAESKAAPAATALQALITTLENYALDLLASDLYVIPLHPTTVAQFQAGFSFDTLHNQLLTSLADTADPDRPLLSGNAVAAAIVVAAGAQTLVNLQAAINLFENLWNQYGGAWARINDRIEATLTYNRLPVAARQGHGTPPNWTRVGRSAVTQIFPPLAAGFLQLEATIRSLAGAAKFAGLVNELTTVLNQQAAMITNTLAFVQQILDTLAAVQAAGQAPGLHLYSLVLDPPETQDGGAIDAIMRVQTAANQPLDQYMVGMVFLLGASSLSSVQRSLTAMTAVFGI